MESSSVLSVSESPGSSSSLAVLVPGGSLLLDQFDVLGSPLSEVASPSGVQSSSLGDQKSMGLSVFNSVLLLSGSQLGVVLSPHGS